MIGGRHLMAQRFHSQRLDLLLSLDTPIGMLFF
jgi:hypothetical protein